MEYSNQLLQAVYAKELQANIGNLYQRIARPKNRKWSIFEACGWYSEGKLQLTTDGEGDLATLHRNLLRLPQSVKEAMDSLNTAEAIDQLFTILKEVSCAEYKRCNAH